MPLPLPSRIEARENGCYRGRQYHPGLGPVSDRVSAAAELNPYVGIVKGYVNGVEYGTVAYGPTASVAADAAVRQWFRTLRDRSGSFRG